MSPEFRDPHVYGQRSSHEEIAEWVGDHRRDHFGFEDDREADARLADRLLAAFGDR